MAGRGAPGTDADFAVITRYLVRFYGLVHVNTPRRGADVCSRPLREGCECRCRVRRVHGKFADVAALVKVDGIDKAKIEEQPEAIRFD